MPATWLPRYWGLWCLAMVVLVVRPSMAQLSPGPLSEPHAQLDGSTDCLACHAPRQGVAADRCLDCHVALRQRVAVGNGLHAQVGDQRCETCHIEHHGRAFELVFWGEEGRDAFDHRRAGWPLDGAHETVGCRECHRPEHIGDLARLVAGKANPTTTYLGLSTDCRTCHVDEHRGQLAAHSCTECHTTTAWKPATGFDHNASAFPLIGAHRDVACSDCHPTRQDPASSTGGTGDATANSTFLQFTDIAHADCADCHRDPHQGSLGASCASCHNPRDWFQVARDDFDHGRTRFPLTGLHRTVACEACHVGGRPATQRVAFASCADCHRDPHQARLGPTCASCHETTGWKHVADGAFDHGQTRFPLRGAHRDVACSACHGSGGQVGGRLEFGRCVGCHSDPHRGQLPATCEDCHRVDSFTPSTFTADDHQRTAFVLDGAHRAVACVDCHLLTEPEALPAGLALQHSGRRAASVPTADDRPTRRFRFASTTCYACHADPHDGTATASEGACSDCHQTASFRQVSATGIAFDHASATGFALAGGHAELPCGACHPGDAATEDDGAEDDGAGGGVAGNRGAGVDRAVRFDQASSTCLNCHQDPHAVGVDCAQCHQPSSWRTTRFDHADDTGFALEGAHAPLDCVACHRVDPVTQRPVRPSTTCEGCHGDGAFISLSSSIP